MNRLAFKFGLFVIAWYEVVVELGLGADTAFVLTLVLFAGFWFARGIAGQIIGLIGPFTFGILLQAALWMGLLWWFAPQVFHAVPYVFDLLIVLGLAIAGARCRILYEDWRLRGGQINPSDHSLLIVISMLGVLALCMFALRSWGSLWPLVGYALLPALPFGFGWRMAPRAVADRHDARVGDADMFRDAGLSEDR